MLCETRRGIIGVFVLIAYLYVTLRVREMGWDGEIYVGREREMKVWKKE